MYTDGGERRGGAGACVLGESGRVNRARERQRLIGCRRIGTKRQAGAEAEREQSKRQSVQGSGPGQALASILSLVWEASHGRETCEVGGRAGTRLNSSTTVAVAASMHRPCPGYESRRGISCGDPYDQAHLIPLHAWAGREYSTTPDAQYDN